MEEINSWCLESVKIDLKSGRLTVPVQYLETVNDVLREMETNDITLNFKEKNFLKFLVEKNFLKFLVEKDFAGMSREWILRAFEDELDTLNLLGRMLTTRLSSKINLKKAAEIILHVLVSRLSCKSNLIPDYEGIAHNDYQQIIDDFDPYDDKEQVKSRENR